MKDNSSTQQWQPCPPGELKSLAMRLGQQRSRRQFLKASAGIAGSLAAALVGWRLFAGTLRSSPARTSYQSPVYAGIACKDVVESAEKYVKLELPAEVAAKIKAHLKLCSSCRGYIDHLAAEQSSSPVA